MPGERGLASYDVDFLADRIARAWAGLLEVADGAVLAAPSRLPGWRGHDVLVHLGAWPEQRPLERMREQARSGSVEPAYDPDAAEKHNARVVDLHRRATPEEVLAALVAARDGTLRFLTAEADLLGQRPVGSVLGELSLLTLLFASTYELAVHALDLGPCGAPPPPSELLDTGLAALLDVTGALAARTRTDGRAAATTPHGGWAFASRDGNWTIAEIASGEPPPSGPVVEASAATLLDASAGRTQVAGLLVSRQLRVHDVPGLLSLMPIVEAVPGLPGGPALRAAGRYLGGAGRLVRRLPGWPR